jgi:hypothetical protein
VLAQTEGEDTPIPPISGFDIDTALCARNITRTSFDELNGNIQGFAHGREIVRRKSEASDPSTEIDSQVPVPHSACSLP